ncbi:MAG: 50S ribosomal protein L10 [Spirochaetales bacterium]|jgi:large subunit ribosomal protein L10|nr:50S ribosomal protein L10 [Spirochaetales bacterium]
MAEYVTNPQPYKVEAVESLKKKFGDFSGYIFTDYRGLTVEQITSLRGSLRKLNAEYRVVKNNFARIAFKELSRPDVASCLVGPTAIALTKDEASQVAKSILDFAKETSVKIKGGLIEGRVFTDKQMEAFSKLPSRLQLLAQLMGTMNAPAQNLACAMNGVAGKLVRTLAAVADKKKAEQEAV